MRLVSIIIPVYNEEDVLSLLIKKLKKVLKHLSQNIEIVFINDGSMDNSLEILRSYAKKDSQYKIISFSRNFGHQNAITAGLESCKGDAAVIIDADLQDPPELIPKMVKLWNQHNYDVVYAKRKKRKGEKWYKTFFPKIFYRLLRAVTDTDIPVDVGDFRLIDRKVIDVLKKMPEKDRFIRGMVSWAGFSQTKIEFVRNKRAKGESKYTLKKMFQLANSGLTSFSSFFLVMPLWFGIICLIGIVVYSLISLLVVGDLDYIIIMIGFIGSIQFVFIGFLGLYIAKIKEESLGRPNYVIEERVN